MSVSVISQTTAVLPGNTAKFVVIENTSKTKRLILSNVMVKIQTDGTVANRYPVLEVTDKNGVVIGAFGGLAVAASQINYHNFCDSVSAICKDGYTNYYCYPLPKKFLEPFEKLNFVLQNGVVGDQFIINTEGYTDKVTFSN